MHAIRHQYSVDDVRRIASALDRAGVDAIEISHGDGLAGSSFNYGFSAHTDREWIEAAVGSVTRAAVTVLLLPGIGTIEDLDAAHAAGRRVGAHCNPLDRSRHREAAHRARAKARHGRRRVPDDGAHDAAGGAGAAGEADGILRRALRLHRRLGRALLMRDVADRMNALNDALDAKTERGMHAHHNLSLGVANTLVAIEHGATRVDGSLAGMGAGAGNAPLEVLVAPLNRSDLPHGCDLFALMDAAEDLIRPMQDRPVRVDRETSRSAMPASIRASCGTPKPPPRRHHLDTRDILVELGRRKNN